MRIRKVRKSDLVAYFTCTVILHTNHNNHNTKSGMKVAVGMSKLVV